MTSTTQQNTQTQTYTQSTSVTSIPTMITTNPTTSTQQNTQTQTQIQTFTQTQTHITTQTQIVMTTTTTSSVPLPTSTPTSTNTPYPTYIPTLMPHHCVNPYRLQDCLSGCSQFTNDPEYICDDLKCYTYCVSIENCITDEYVISCEYYSQKMGDCDVDCSSASSIMINIGLLILSIMSIFVLF